MVFSLVTHAAGIMGMPRRVYSASFQGSPVAAQWESMTAISAVGGVILYVSSLFYLIVLVGTAWKGRKIEPPPIEFALSLDGTPERRGLWDRFPLWTMIAVVMIVAAYALPIWHLVTMERFGSLPYKPF